MVINSLFNILKKYFNIKFWIINDLKFSKKEIKNFDFFQTRIFVLLIRDVLNYEIKTPPKNADFFYARLIIEDHLYNLYISRNFYERIKLYLGSPNTFITNSDMQYYKEWIEKLNPVFSEKNSISLNFDKSVDTTEAQNQIENLKKLKVIYL